MNKQKKSAESRGIEWTDFTWNPVGGCKHACRWTMPDGSTAICYAEEVANGVARHAYPQGFDAHYWHPAKLDEPLKLKTPSRIFLDSMADLMGAWVPEDQIRAVLDIAEQAPQHTFQLLTKNAPRLLKFTFPQNVWVGVSMPPTQILGKPLADIQQLAMLRRSMATLNHLRKQGNHQGVRWISFEPLSWDVAGVIEDYPGVLEWAVIGAATNGKKTYQPEKAWVENLLNVLDQQGVKVFFKGNLEWPEWREEFPVIEAPKPELEIKQLTLEVTAPQNAPVAPLEPFLDDLQADHAQVAVTGPTDLELAEAYEEQYWRTWKDLTAMRTHRNSVLEENAALKARLELSEGEVIRLTKTSPEQAALASDLIKAVLTLASYRQETTVAISIKHQDAGQHITVSENSVYKAVMAALEKYQTFETQTMKAKAKDAA